MTEQNIYERAIEVLHERGWTQLDHGSSEAGPVCLAGAAALACGLSDPNDWCPRLGEFEELLRTVVPGPAMWNDAPERTKEDVVTLLKFAAADELDTWKKLYGPGVTGG